MMIYPPIDELSDKVQSRYELVTALSKRAREIIAEDSHSTDKPVSTAIDEFYEGKIEVESGSDE